MAAAVDNEVMDAFLVEAGELLDALADQLVALEAQPRDSELLNAVFRAFHTVKGGAGFLAVRPMVELCHRAEELLNDARNQRVLLQPAHFDCLLQVLDILLEMMQALRDGSEVPSAPGELLQALQAAPAAAASQSTPATAAAAPAPPPAEPASAAKAATDEVEAAFLSMLGDPGSDGASTDTAAKPAGGDAIDDDEFERLLDELHGDGHAPGAAPAKADDKIDDSEFEALLDSIYGKGGAPGVDDGGSAANTGEGGSVASADEGNSPSSENSPRGVIPAQAGTHFDSGDGTQMDSGLRRHDEQEASRAAAPAREPTAVPASDEKRATHPPDNTESTKHKTETTVRVDTQRIDALVNATGELVLVRNRLANLTARGTDSEMERAVNNLNRVAADLQMAALRMRMQPIGRLFQRFPRIVRDLARKLGKRVTLEQHGEDTNLDRTLVESLADPLIHLLRNAVDHGLEDPDARAQAGKPAEGTVTLSAGQEGERILISISDDGRGMDPEVLRRKAIEKGIINAEQAHALEPAECLALIFRPGFSTRSEISDISGRGVGMDVVKTNVAALGGTIDIDSTPGTGTTIRIGIPLTLAIMRVLMVRVGERQLALPLANVVEVFELDRAQVRSLDGRVVAAHRGRPLPLSDLATWAGVETDADARAHVVVVHVGHQQFGLLATEVYGREEIMIKPLGSHLKHLSGIAGATITGDGRIALVLDLVALADSPLPPPLKMKA
jgi:two-component system chemotaxis sensor kinase CheA